MPEQLADSEHWMYVWAAYGVTFAILAGLFLHSIVSARRNERQLNAHVEMLHGFSGHADRNGLLEWVGAMQKQPRRTFLVHGEPESAEALSGVLKAEIGLPQVDIPDMHQSFEV